MSTLSASSDKSRTLLEDLRAETRFLHHRLETRLAVFDRLQNPEEYTRLLLRYWGLYKPLEDRLAAAPLLPTYFPELCAKLPLLERDLSLLGRGAGERLMMVPRCTALPPLSDAAKVVGCRYVLAGASLGGQVIARHARLSQVPPFVTRALAFFCGDSDDTGRRWREFLQALERWEQEASPHERERSVASAQDTFAVFEAWLCGEQDHA